MTEPLAPLPPQQQSTALVGGFIHSDFMRWLGRLFAALMARQVKLTILDTLTADATVSAWDFVPVDTSSGAVVVTLPTPHASLVGARIVVKHTAGGSSCTVSGSIDGYSSAILALLASFNLFCDGSAWWII